MKLMEQLKRLDRLSRLIRRKATGTPDELASRMGVSRNTVFNMIKELENLGAEIEYCKKRRSYQYVVEIEISFEVVVFDG